MQFEEIITPIVYENQELYDYMITDQFRYIMIGVYFLSGVLGAVSTWGLINLVMWAAAPDKYDF